MKIPVVENILNANDQLALENRARLDEARVFALNIMASPGAGKTSLMERTVHALKAELKIGMINGDTAPANMDAVRGQNAGASAVHINTGGNCHLEASMIRNALNQFELHELDLLIVENVGNLVCPSGWDLGTHKRVLVASIPEGADKPYKYPSMYRGVDVLVINKIDLLPYVPFDMAYFRQGVEVLNPGVQIIELSCQTGEGVENWVSWVRQSVSQMRAFV
jgi:hydrogenase nickel incorporation protein HypB